MKGSGEIIRDQRWKVCGEESKLVTLSWRMRWPLRKMRFGGRQPEFTFSHITRDSNLLNPHLHKNHRYTTPNLHEPIFSQPQIYTTRFYTNPNIHSHKIKPNMRHWVSHKARVFSRPARLKARPWYLTRGWIMSHLYMQFGINTIKGLKYGVCANGVFV